MGGWDRILEVKEGNEYVPAGTSLWEFGSEANFRKKVNDYK